MKQETGVTKGAMTMVKTNAELLEQDLRYARMLSSETLHCAFRYGLVWKN